MCDYTVCSHDVTQRHCVRSDREVKRSDLEVERSDLEVERSDLEVERSDLEVEICDLEVEICDLEVERSDLEVERCDLDVERSDLEVETMKTCVLFQAFNWLLRNVTQATCLHDLMWYFVAALTPLPAEMDESAAPPEKKEKKDPDLVCNV